MPKQLQKPDNRVIFALIAIHLAIVLPLAYILNVWSDEGSTLYSTQNGLINAIAHAAIDEKQAPLYFWILSVWRSVDPSIFFARLFSIVCSCGSILVFGRLAARIFRKTAAIAAVVFFALHPFLIWASLEVRVYSLVILISVALVSQFLRVTDDESKGVSDRIAFCALATIAIYTNYYLGFVLVGMFASLVVTRRWRQMGEFVAMMFPVAIVFVPVVMLVKVQMAANTGGFQEPREVLDCLRLLWHYILTFTLPAGVFPADPPDAFGIARVWIVRVAIVVLAFGTVKYRRGLSAQTAILGMNTLGIVACLGLAYSVLGSDYLAIRHVSVLFAPFILFIASLTDDVSAGSRTSAAKRSVGALAIIAVAAFFAYSLFFTYSPMAKRGDWTRVAAFIQTNEKPGQPIVVFTVFDTLAMKASYTGINPVLPNKGYFSFESEAEPGSEDSLRRQTDFVISQIPADANELWIATNQKCAVGNTCLPLEKYLAANYTVVTERDFYLEKVRLLRKIKK